MLTLSNIKKAYLPFAAVAIMAIMMTFVAVNPSGINASTETNPIESFTLVDTSDQTDIVVLSEGAELDLDNSNSSNFGFRVDTDSDASIGSVAISLSGAKSESSTENIAPYSLYGDSNTGADSDLNGESLPAGSYTISATAYSESSKQGDNLGSLSVNFSVEEPIVLEAPTGITISGSGSFNYENGFSAVLLTWYAPESATSYEVHANTGDGWSRWGSLITDSDADINDPDNEDAREYDLTRLMPQSTYQFKIRALADDTTGPWSATVSVTTRTLPVPTGLEHSDVTSTSVTLSWNEPVYPLVGSDGNAQKPLIDYYNVWFVNPCTSQAQFHSKVTSGTSTDITGLTPSSLNAFRVTAVLQQSGAETYDSVFTGFFTPAN